MTCSPAKTKVIAVVLLAGVVPLLASMAAHFIGDTQHVLAPLHACFELVGTYIALSVAMLLLLRMSHKNTTPHLLWVVAALVAMGIVDVIHSLIPVGVAFSWTRHGATLVGGVLFGLVWLPLPAVVIRRKGCFIFAVAVLAIAGALAMWWWPERLPAPWVAGNYSHSVMSINVLGGVGFLAAALFFIRRYLRETQAEDLVFASQTLLFGVASLFFGFSHVWATDWWIWHSVQLLAFSAVLVVAYDTVATLYQRLARHAQELKDRVHERTMELATANTALQESLERLQLANRATFDIIWDWNLQTNALGWNENFQTQYGYPAEEIEPGIESWTNRIHPGDLERVKTGIHAAIDAQQDHWFDHYRFRRKDGRYAEVEDRGYITRDASGHPVRMIGAMQDITQRKRLEEAAQSANTELQEMVFQYKTVSEKLRVHQIELELQNEELCAAQAALDAARARYFDLYDQAPVGYVTLSDTGLILEANLTAATLLDTVRSLAVKRPLSQFILQEDQDIYYLHHKMLLATDTPQVFELRVLKKEGQPCWVRLNATVAQDAGGMPVYRVTLSDISDRKRAEAEREKLEVQNRQLQKSESLSRMAGAIAHHFNNQLMAVMGNLELAMENLPQDTRLFATLNAAMQAGCRAAEMSSLMLTYLGQTPSAHVLLDLSKFCCQNLKLLRAALPNSAVLETELPMPGPVVNASASQIQQVLTNLLTNAWESNGSVIRLTVSTVAAADIPTVKRFPVDSQLKEQGYACLTVADTGCGIADKDVEQLFDPFFSTKFIGRGLGLPVVLGIVRAHGGTITVESTLNHGSSFRVFLPLSLPAQTNAKSLTKAGAIDGRPNDTAPAGTVLVVEDDEAVRKVIADTLARLGFTVLAAPDGVAALELFQQHQAAIRCVLCDLTMPGMDGWATLTALRQLAPGLPVILVSGCDEAQVMAGDHPELPNAFLEKPFQMQALRDALGKAPAK